MGLGKGKEEKKKLVTTIVTKKEKPKKTVVKKPDKKPVPESQTLPVTKVSTDGKVDEPTKLVEPQEEQEQEQTTAPKIQTQKAETPKQLDPNEELFLRRVEQLRTRRTDATQSMSKEVKTMLDAVMQKRRIVKGELDTATMKGKNVKKIKEKKKKLEKLDDEIKRILDSSASILDKTGAKLTDADIEKLRTALTSLDKMAKGKADIDAINDRKLARELGLLDGGKVFDDTIKSELAKIKAAAANEDTQTEPTDLSGGVIKNLSELDKQPPIRTLIMEQHRIKNERDRLKIAGGSHTKRRALTKKAEKLQKRIEEARRATYLIKYGFPDSGKPVKEGEKDEQKEARLKHEKEMFLIKVYEDRKKLGVKPDLKVKPKRPDGTDKTPEEMEKEKKALKEREKQLSEENITAIKKEHKEKFCHTVAVQMGLLTPTEKLSDLSDDKRKRLDKIIDSVLGRPGKIEQRMTMHDLQTKITELGALREKALEAAPPEYRDEIQKLVTKLRIAQSEFDIMDTGGAGKAVKHKASKDSRQRRVLYLQNRINALINAAVVLNAKDASKEDTDKVKKKSKNIMDKRFGHVNKSIVKANKTARYTIAVQLGIIKQGERLDNANKQKMKKILVLMESMQEEQGLKMLSKNVQKDFAETPDTPEITALVNQLRELHEKREAQKKKHAREIPVYQAMKKAEKLEKEILRLRKIEFVKRTDVSEEGAEKTDFEKNEEERQKILKRKPKDFKNLKTAAGFDPQLAELDRKRDEIVNKSLAVKMGLIQPGQKELKKDVVKQMNDVIGEVSKKAIYDTLGDRNMDAIQLKSEVLAKQREETLQRITKDDHRGDPLLKELFAKYRKSLLTRRALQIGSEVDEVDVSTAKEQVKGKVAKGGKSALKKINGDPVKDADKQLKYLIDCCTTVIRVRNEELKKTLEEQQKDPQDTVPGMDSFVFDQLKKDKEKKEEGKTEEGTPAPPTTVGQQNNTDPAKKAAKKLTEPLPALSMETLMDKEVGKKLNLRSMAVNMGYIKADEKLPAHISKQLKLIVDTANIPVADEKSLVGYGADMAKKYMEIGDEDPILIELIAKRQKFFDDEDAIKGKSKSKEKRRLKLHNKALEVEKLIRDRKRLLMVQRFGFEGDKEGFDRFVNKLEEKKYAEQIKQGYLNQASINPSVKIGSDIKRINKIIESCDAYIGGKILQQYAKMLGFEHSGDILEDEEREKLYDLIRQVDNQAFIDLQKEEFKKTPAYKRIETKLKKGLYSEVLEKRIEKEEIDKDTKIVGTELDKDAAKVLKAMKPASQLTKQLAKQTKKGNKLMATPQTVQQQQTTVPGMNDDTTTQTTIPAPVTNVTNAGEMGFRLTGAALYGAVGIMKGVQTTIKIMQDVQLNSGRRTDLIIDSLKAVGGYSSVIGAVTKTVGMSMGTGVVGSSQQVMETGVPIVAIITSAAKIAANVVQAAQSYQIMQESKEALKNLQDGYNAAEADDIDAFEMLSLINMAAKRRGTEALFNIGIGFFRGASRALMLSGVATVGIGSMVAGFMKKISLILKVAKHVHKLAQEERHNTRFIEGVLSDSETQGFVNSPGFRSLSKENQDRLILQSFDSGSKKDFANMMRIIHAQDLKERIDSGKLRELDKKILRMFGFKFDDDNTATLKGISVHELALKMGYKGKNWQESLRSLEETKQFKRQKKDDKKLKELKKTGHKQGSRGFDYNDGIVGGK